MLISGIVDTKISHNIWNKLFKRELFDDVKFPNGVFLSEDLHTFVRLIFKAKKIAKFNTAFYKYRIGDNNTSGFESLKGMKDHKFVYEDLISFINKNDINNKEKLIQKLSYRKIRSTYLPLVFCKKDLSNANFVKALEILKSDLTEILSSSGFKKLGFKYQILFYILKFAKKNEQICTIFEYFSKLNGVFKKRKEKIFKD